jgi:hypothetical protein
MDINSDDIRVFFERTRSKNSEWKVVERFDYRVEVGPYTVDIDRSRAERDMMSTRLKVTDPGGRVTYENAWQMSAGRLILQAILAARAAAEVMNAAFLPPAEFARRRDEAAELAERGEKLPLPLYVEERYSMPL